ncbi:GNAT family N-acetyltransferase [Rhodocyclus gracilis]|uniref:GNAT family N-acetyltransferase n=1 Tax=Rhodocyclus tenuis TaxID=1066 RepID=A0A6L5JXA3_RHOTE|nr:GNAT family N-acetyltransferase [Rhodocyclus gracilis]
MQPADMPVVLDIQSQCYPPEMNEPEALYRERLTASAGWTWVAVNEMGVCAYLFGYRSPLGKITPLGAPFAPQHDAYNLYLHDLAVSPRVAGLGVAGALVRHALACAMAAGLSHSSLVSVQGSREFWQRQGYTVVSALAATQTEALASYPGPAFYMVNSLDKALAASLASAGQARHV